jgi:dienelactone hydrolase
MAIPSHLSLGVLLSLPALLLLPDETAGAEPTPDLPEVLRFNDGARITSPQQWPKRRAEILHLMQEHFTGHPPKSIPRIVAVENLKTTKANDGSLREHIQVTLDTTNRVTLSMWVWTPVVDGPYPLLLTAPRHYQIGWAELALKRGYKVCLFPGVDSHHQEQAYPGFDSQWLALQRAYPDANWTEIVTKAWLAGRCLDYLLDDRYGHQVNPKQVGIVGHSRYGKAAMIAGAIDERFTCVVARSPGSPGNSPYRFTSRNTFNETPSDFPSRWFLPSLRDYRGREHELPFDAHGWMALIAPRSCLVHVAHNDDSGPTFGDERSYLEARHAYTLLGVGKNVRLHYRTGGHDPITDEHRRDNLDWFDLSFGRGDAEQEDFPVELIHNFDWDAWKASQPARDLQVPQTVPNNATREEIASRIEWTLGQKPDVIAWHGEYTFQSPADAEMRSHDRWAVDSVTRLPVSFGENVHGNVYHRADLDKPAPVVIWLHPYSYPSGFNEAYGVEGTTVYYRLAQNGYIVLAYDQCGFGGRLLEGRDFYADYPRWSRLGRMVHDVQSAVDFLLDGTGAAHGEMPRVDRAQLHVLGYSLGAIVGLYAAASDERITTVGAFCGLSPLRAGAEGGTTGGNEVIYQWHALVPKLGLFAGHEAHIPYDYNDVLSLVAPRRVLMYAPKRDRFSKHDKLVEVIRRAEGKVTLMTPDDENRFQSSQHEMYLKWLSTEQKGERVPK